MVRSEWQEVSGKTQIVGGKTRRGTLHRLRRWLLARRGFNLVVLTMSITVLNIMIAMALPLASQQIRRDDEAELIFRGLQYAEAIRVFQQRQGRFPGRMEELLKVEPRSIRQLWKNPMNEDGTWALILQGQPPPQQPPPGIPRGDDSHGQTRPGPPTFTPGTEDDASGGGRQVTVAPIQGVQDLDGSSTVITFFGNNETSSWHFTQELLQAPQGGPLGQAGAAGLTLPPNAGNLGKSFPPGITPPTLGNGNGLNGGPGNGLGNGPGIRPGPGSGGGGGEIKPDNPPPGGSAR
jgi:type II secretory pathway pseudopilin PulG